MRSRWQQWANQRQGFRRTARTHTPVPEPTEMPTSGARHARERLAASRPIRRVEMPLLSVHSVLVLFLLTAPGWAWGQTPSPGASFFIPQTVQVVRDLPYAQTGPGGGHSGQRMAAGRQGGVRSHRGCARRAGVRGGQHQISTEQKAPFPAVVYDTKAAVRWLRVNAAAYGWCPSRRRSPLRGAAAKWGFQWRWGSTPTRRIPSGPTPSGSATQWTGLPTSSDDISSSLGSDAAPSHFARTHTVLAP